MDWLPSGQELFWPRDSNPSKSPRGKKAPSLIQKGRGSVRREAKRLWRSEAESSVEGQERSRIKLRRRGAKAARLRLGRRGAKVLVEKNIGSERSHSTEVRKERSETVREEKRMIEASLFLFIYDNLSFLYLFSLSSLFIDFSLSSLFIDFSWSISEFMS